MGIVYRCLSLLALCTLLYACPAEPPAADEPSPEPEDEPYFTLSCLRATPGDGGLRWYCSGDPETDLITGKIVLYYNATGDGALIFCAKDTILNSGNLQTLQFPIWMVAVSLFRSPLGNLAGIGMVILPWM